MPIPLRTGLDPPGRCGMRIHQAMLVLFYALIPHAMRKEA